jgi:hypothetical protein
MIIRGTSLADSMSQYLTERIAGRADIDVRYHTVVRALGGSQRLERVEVEDTTTTTTRETLPAAALIILVGAKPHTKWLTGSVRLDDGGYIITGPELGPGARHQITVDRPGPRALSAGDQCARRLRRWRRPQRLGDTGRSSRRRRLYRDPVRQRVPRPPRRLRHVAPAAWLRCRYASRGPPVLGICSVILAIIPAGHGGRMIFTPLGWASRWISGRCGWRPPEEKPWASGYADVHVLVHRHRRFYFDGGAAGGCVAEGAG